ncbi:IS481 family transposase [Paraburkholderia terricola]|uniref:IS481 family transposase n=1 Tax=Paraburkholderia terricola TaxID=169427 RepID=UPI00286B74AC|nr:IS481 family transposase [Paraburkholderia terricola]
MPWNARDTMSLRQEFVHLASQRTLTVTELCERFNISRQTGYKWLRRGEDALADQSRRPASSPSKTTVEMEQEVVRLRQAHPRWGGRKISRRLRDLGFEAVPQPSTVTAILHRHNLILPAGSAMSEPWKRFEHEQPNVLWQMDFKGHFDTLEQGRCSPLTVLDDHSRFSILLRACGPTDTATVQAGLREAFGHYGLPLRINTDNGSPWGSPGSPGQLTELAVWLIRLGIRISYSRPYHPQTNGKDERFHRTLKAEVLNERSFATQQHVQRELDRWRTIYNCERPHEAIGMDTPMSRYQPSPRAFPSVLREPEYGPDDVVLGVKANSELRFEGRRLKVSKALYRLPVAARAKDGEDGVFEFWFAHHRILTLDLRSENR